MGDTTPLALPPELPFPIKVSRLFVQPGDKVKRGDRMLEYTFLSATRRKELAVMEREGKVPSPGQSGNDMVGSWECPINGEVVGWENGIKPGAQIERRGASKPIVRIEQPCTHPVQFNGMCGVCGADITNDDYMSPPTSEAGPSRYPGSFELAHDASGVTVSTNEAKRLETQTKGTLLAARKLSLIVDLDQTIIHTTVDPTVGEWLKECEEDAKRNSEDKEADTDKAAESTTPPGSPKQKREPNPNAEALKDVARFQLAEDLPPSAVKGKGRAPSNSRWYYTKPRPGLKEFLDTMSQLYEMHVYTMGTRSYADAICKIVDPEGKIFGGRILSRDESGSMSSKSLIRLFPTDQSMVVVIDDRSDVWGDCPNLVKVVPYDFFIGIGDINSSFLPPTQPTVTPPGQPPTPGTDRASSAASTPPPETPPEIPSAEEGLMRQNKLLDEMAESRPLAKLEKENDEKEDGCESDETPTAEEPKAPPTEKKDSKDNEDEQHGPHVLHLRHPHHRKALLNPNDYELDRVGGILRTIHSQYYEYYDRFDKPDSDELPMSCDTPLLIQELKDQVLQGCVLAFTGVIPRNVEPEKAEIWQLAESFGAVCVHDLSPKVTHLVTASLGTEKMYRASKIPSIKTVWLGWLQSCIALWEHEPEEPFIASHPSASASQSRNDSPPPDGGDESSGEKEQNFEWDDAAQAEFDAFMEEMSDDEEGSGEDGHGAGVDAEGEDDRQTREKSPKSVIENDETHRWSRASTPGPSILSRAPSPGRETPKAVAWADDENKPLEHVRETKPGDIVSFPPHKKRKVLMLEAPGDDDDIPEANRMTYKAKPSWQTSNGEDDDESEGGSGEPSEDDDDAAAGEPAASSEAAATPDVPPSDGTKATSAEADAADALGRLAISNPDETHRDK